MERVMSPMLEKRIYVVGEDESVLRDGEMFQFIDKGVCVFDVTRMDMRQGINIIIYKLCQAIGFVNFSP